MSCCGVTRPVCRFLFKRLWMSFLTDEVRPVEIVLAVFFFLIRGTWLFGYGYYHPGIEHFLRGVGLTEHRLAACCYLAAGLHLWSAGTACRWKRVAASIFGIALAMAIITTFGAVEPHWHPVAVVWFSVLSMECYLLFRHFLGPYDGDP